MRLADDPAAPEPARPQPSSDVDGGQGPTAIGPGDKAYPPVMGSATTATGGTVPSRRPQQAPLTAAP